VVVTVFFDTSVLLAGLIDFGPQSAPAQTLMHAVAEGRFDKAATAWHCCLEFYSVATRLPPEYRLAPADAVALLGEEVFARKAVHDLPPANREATLRAAGAEVVVTDNRRHFLSALRYGLRVETPGEFVAALKKKPRP
jgi:predicted nucleic acid-binding protein